MSVLIGLTLCGKDIETAARAIVVHSVVSDAPAIDASGSVPAI